MPAKRRRVSAALKRRHKQAVTRAVKMKVKYNLSYQQLRDLVNMYNEEEAEIVMRLVRHDFEDKGYFAHRLHGCAGCENFIWMKHEDMICPNCNNADGR
jgi:rubrerythrin